MKTYVFKLNGEIRKRINWEGPGKYERSDANDYPIEYFKSNSLDAFQMNHPNEMCQGKNIEEE